MLMSVLYLVLTPAQARGKGGLPAIHRRFHPGYGEGVLTCGKCGGSRFHGLICLGCGTPLQRPRGDSSSGARPAVSGGAAPAGSPAVIRGQPASPAPSSARPPADVLPGRMPRAPAPARPAPPPSALPELPLDALEVLPLDALEPLPADPPPLAMDAIKPLAPAALKPLPPVAPEPPPLDLSALMPLEPDAAPLGGPAQVQAPVPAPEVPGFVNKTCPSCQASVKDPNGAFCDACGMKLPRIKLKGGSSAPSKGGRRRVVEDDVQCFDCGTKNNAERQLCKNCGMPLPRRGDN